GLVRALLDGGRGDPRRPDSVAAHYDRALSPAIVEIVGAERLRVARAELEDVPDLDRRLDPDRAADRASIALLDHSDVDEGRPEVPPGLDPAQVLSLAVGAGHVHALLQRGIGDHLDP